jgi:hypothetical protein
MHQVNTVTIAVIEIADKCLKASKLMLPETSRQSSKNVKATTKQ